MSKNEPLNSIVRANRHRQAKRPRTKYLVRYILPSDNHLFIGRIYDLSIVSLHFDDYKSLCQYSDCKYAYDVNAILSTVVRRVESLNLVGDMIWPEVMPKNIKEFPISRYEWLTVAADAFLMRFISIVDCVLLLVNEVYETKLEPRKCTIERLRAQGVDKKVVKILEEMMNAQGALRSERNSRFHHGIERAFTEDDQTFRMASLFERSSNGLKGKDAYGRKIDVDRSFKEGLVELQRDFNGATRDLIKRLNCLYDRLAREFEIRFIPRFRNASHGFGAVKQIKRKQP